MSRKGELIVCLVIDDFSEYIEISKKRMAQPYVKGKCRIPKKYSDINLFNFDSKNRLINIKTGEIIVKNIRTVGKPRHKKVNGQEIYNGNISRQARAGLVKHIHNYFKTKIDVKSMKESLSNISLYPLTIELVFVVQDKGKGNIDNDNKWIWRKCFQDTLTELGIIPDDNVNIISRNEEETVLVPEDHKQQLIINIYGQSRD